MWFIEAILIIVLMMVALGVASMALKYLLIIVPMIAILLFLVGGLALLGYGIGIFLSAIFEQTGAPNNVVQATPIIFAIIGGSIGLFAILYGRYD